MTYGFYNFGTYFADFGRGHVLEHPEAQSTRGDLVIEVGVEQELFLGFSAEVISPQSAAV